MADEPTTTAAVHAESCECDSCLTPDALDWLDAQLRPSMLTIANAAAFAGTTVRTVRRWIAADRLPVHHQEGRAYVYEPDLIRVELATRRHGGRPRMDLHPAAMS